MARFFALLVILLFVQFQLRPQACSAIYGYGGDFGNGLSGAETSTDDIVNAYEGLVSNSGSYELVGDSINYSIVVAKYPNFMNDNPRNSQHITIEKDKILFKFENDKGKATTTLERIK